VSSLLTISPRHSVPIHDEREEGKRGEERREKKEREEREEREEWPTVVEAVSSCTIRVPFE